MTSSGITIIDPRTETLRTMTRVTVRLYNEGSGRHSERNIEVRKVPGDEYGEKFDQAFERRDGDPPLRTRATFGLLKPKAWYTESRGVVYVKGRAGTSNDVLDAIKRELDDDKRVVGHAWGGDADE